MLCFVALNPDLENVYTHVHRSPRLSHMIAEPSQADFESDFVDADGVETHYWEHGPEDGTPLIMVHGGGAGADSWGNWKYAMPRLAAEGFHVYAMDMVGFGRSATPDPEEFRYTNQARIDQIVAFADAIGEDRPSLVGNSMGGAASLGVAQQHPELVDTLVLVGGAGYRTPGERPQKTRDAIEVLSSFDGSRDAMHDVIDVLSVTEWYDRDAMVDHRVANYERDGVADAHSATMRIATSEHDMYYEADDFRDVGTETLLIYGRDDPIIPPEDAWGMFNLLEQSSLHLLDRCGHWVMVDALDQAVGVITGFFEQTN